MITEQKNAARQAIRRMLRPVVRLLLRNGITCEEFAALSKEVFVEVARDDYGIQGRPTNTARVALMTGLSRREVARVKKVLEEGELKAESPPASRISQILTAWHVDPEFLDAKGKPAVLPRDGDRASIAALLERYAGDMPRVAVFKELTQLSLVAKTTRGFRVTSRDYIRGAADPDLLRQAGVALRDHANTIVHNVDAQRRDAPRFERMATTNALARRHVAAFRKMLEAEGQAFLERVDTWLSAHAQSRRDDPTTARDRPVRTGVGVYLIHDELGETP